MESGGIEGVVIGIGAECRMEWPRQVDNEVPDVTDRQRCTQMQKGCPREHDRRYRLPRWRGGGRSWWWSERALRLLLRGLVSGGPWW